MEIRLRKYTSIFYAVLTLLLSVGCASVHSPTISENGDSKTKTINACVKTNLSLQHLSMSARIQRVKDGDTVVLSSGETVRLAGVDTPETVHPRKPVEFFGKEASNFTRATLEGKDVILVFDRHNTQAKHRDKFKRLLAYVYRSSDGLDINAEIVRKGYGRAFPRYPAERSEEFLCLEREAQSAKRGLWGG